MHDYDIILNLLYLHSSITIIDIIIIIIIIVVVVVAVVVVIIIIIIIIVIIIIIISSSSSSSSSSFTIIIVVVIIICYVMLSIMMLMLLMLQGQAKCDCVKYVSISGLLKTSVMFGESHGESIVVRKTKWLNFWTQVRQVVVHEIQTPLFHLVLRTCVSHYRCQLNSGSQNITGCL